MESPSDPGVFWELNLVRPSDSLLFLLLVFAGRQKPACAGGIFHRDVEVAVSAPYDAAGGSKSVFEEVQNLGGPLKAKSSFGVGGCSLRLIGAAFAGIGGIDDHSLESSAIFGSDGSSNGLRVGLSKAGGRDTEEQPGNELHGHRIILRWLALGG